METRESAVFAFRFGYGLPGAGSGFDSIATMMQQLNDADPLPAKLREQTASARLLEEATISKELRSASGDQKREKRVTKLETRRNDYEADSHARLMVAVASAFPFFERVVSFWSNHFTVSVRNPAVRTLAGPYEVEAIRPHIMGSFRDLLRAVELHPAMVRYLDLGKSVGPNSPFGERRAKGLNENLAREVLELHTLGVDGGYSQQDVTSFAKIMTGWATNHEHGAVEFNYARAEPGSKVMLGTVIGAEQASAEDYPQALDLVARHPSTARFIARKLVAHFVSSEPDPQSVQAVEQAFVQNDGNLPAVYRSLVSLPESSRGLGLKARNDFEFVVASLRAAKIGPDELAAIDRGNRKRPNPLSAGALDLLAQPMWGAPSPAGWSERPEEWLSPVGLAQRLEWIPSVVERIKDATAEEFLDRILGPLASDQTRNVVRAASNREEGLALVLASPEFNRR